VPPLTGEFGDHSSWVWVLVKVIGRRKEESSKEYRFLVPPRLHVAMDSLFLQLGEIIPHDQLQSCLVVINGMNVQALDPETTLCDGDNLILVPPIAGG
jgi:molybdopterin converting factor small subunit